MNRIKRRHSPELIDNSLLLPSQQLLLDLPRPENNWSNLHQLTPNSMNQLGELLASKINPVFIESLENPKSYSSSRTINTLSVLAQRLIQCDDPSAFGEFVSVGVRDGYDNPPPTRHGIYEAYSSSEDTHFTPQGLVRNPPSGFRQKAVAVDMMTSKLEPHENKASLHLYTDNLSAQPPAWQVVANINHSDIFPSPYPFTYELHAAPDHFQSEELGFFVVDALSNILKNQSKLNSETTF